MLNLPNIQIEDMGEYYCIADNNVPPVVSYRVYIYVLCKHLNYYITNYEYILGN